VADPQQEDIGRGLHDRERDDRPHQVLTRDDAIQPCHEQPRGDRERQEAHCWPPWISSAWSRNWVHPTRKAPLTSSPTAMLASGIWPAESRWPGIPNGRKFLKKMPMKIRPPKPTRA